MAVTNRPPTLVEGWAGAWGLNVRWALVALRDEGPLTLREVANVLRWKALHSDLTSGHPLGPDHGATMLAEAILEDAASIVVVHDDGRYSIPSDLTSFTSPFTGQPLKLLTPDEQAAAKAKNDIERPVRMWAKSDAYSPFGGKWVDGRLPGRKHTTDEVADKAAEIAALGWRPGARITKDQRGVIIEGHLRHDALRLLGIDPDTATDPRSGEPYVEVRGFNNDAARLYFALQANWSTLMAPTKKAIEKQVLGGQPLTLETVTGLIQPLADLMAPTPDSPVTVAIDDRDDDDSPVTITPEFQHLLDQLGHARAVGLTSKQFVDLNGVPWDHQKVSARLHRLERYNKLITRLKGVDRDGYAPYVLREWVQGGDGTAAPSAADQACRRRGTADRVHERGGRHDVVAGGCAVVRVPARQGSAVGVGDAVGQRPGGGAHRGDHQRPEQQVAVAAADDLRTAQQQPLICIPCLPTTGRSVGWRAAISSRRIASSLNRSPGPLGTASITSSAEPSTR